MTSGMSFKNKTITLMGMSGVGKTHLSLMLAKQGWHHHSCDYEIGVNYLRDEIEQTLGEPNTITSADISQLSRYVGKLGAGHLNFEEFKRRQAQYYNAECQSLADLGNVVKGAHAQGHDYVVNDSTGSFCELGRDDIYDYVGEHSLVVYIKANAEEEKAVLQRAQDYPKPMFFPPYALEGWVEDYRMLKGLPSADDFDVDDFSRWIFPQLFKSRLPKYQALADKYGITIESDVLRDVESADEFLGII